MLLTRFPQAVDAGSGRRNRRSEATALRVTTIRRMSRVIVGMKTGGPRRKTGDERMTTELRLITIVLAAMTMLRAPMKGSRKITGISGRPMRRKITMRIARLT